ncbi:putative repeat protein (TIGR01451 family) [Wenzhouxiangella marina]|nr:C25 family cysteine peptidase [Wenzhouxiangella marina]MBB6087582.1 putative repeat protein (TIGR01451 family) [Wenzhouxiangella marina]
MRASVGALVLSFVMAGHALADLTVTPITWDVVGLDSNRPLTSGPELFPVGARVCTDTAISNATVNFIWEDLNDAFIFTRPGSLSTLESGPLGVGECFDAYFEIQLTRSAAAFDEIRPYRIDATDNDSALIFSSPTPRQIYVERLISQNRNSTQQIRWGQQANQSDWQILGAGGGLNLAVGQTYFIELITQTATAYEQLQSFLTLSNTIFQVKSVETTYSALTAPPTRVPVPNPSLYADGCLWEPDPNSPNYLSCLETGKAGGPITTVYEIDIIAGGGEQVALLALIYDKSGSSFHYNTDVNQSPGDIIISDPTDATIQKRFTPSTIAADGTSTMRLTISNPNPFEVSGYRFIDPLPSIPSLGSMLVANPANASSSCGGTLVATPGTATVDFSGGVIAANSTCTILVDVTVPAVVGATYPFDLLNSVDLFVGDATTPSDTATATLTVVAEPPPPVQCTPIAPGSSVAEWSSFESLNNPNHPTTGPVVNDFGVTTAAGAGVVTTVDNNNRWETSVPNGEAVGTARTNNRYYEFVLDTTGLDLVNLSFVVSRQNNNGPSTITLDYGPAGSITENAAQWGPVNSGSPPSTFSVANLTNLNPAGNTFFRLIVSGASNNSNIPIRIHSANFTGQGEICTTITALTPPTLAKVFNPSTVYPGEPSTLTFTVTNPNPADALNGVTFRDELPPGMTSVGGSFVNTGCGGTWGLDGGDPTVLLLTDAVLAGGASCTLSVDVTSDSIGDNINISDPVDADETLPGNSATDTLVVLPPPPPASIDKTFDPNPLLNTAGSSTLTFQITNNDPTLTISQVAFTDTLPTTPVAMVPAASPIVFSDNGNCGGAFSFTWDGSALNFSNGEILGGQVCELEINVVVPGLTPGDLPAQFDNQTSTVTHVFQGVTYTGNQADATLLVDEPIPGIQMLKQVGLLNDPEAGWADYLALPLGGEVFYKLTIENIGETPLVDVNFIDPNPQVDTSGCPSNFALPVVNPLQPTDHIAVCIIGPVNAGTAGVFVNTATATGTGNGTPVQDSDSATYATTEITLVKSADRASFGFAGEVINYSFTVENTGFATLRGPVQINDDVIGIISCPALSTVGNGDNFFNPGEVVVCTASYTATVADATAGSVTNIAFAFTPEDQSNNDTVTVNYVSTTDFGDAPASYSTPLAANGPHHVISGPWMAAYGNAVGNPGANDTDADTDGIASVLADGDLGDEQGVALADFRSFSTGQAVSCDGVEMTNDPVGDVFEYCAAVRVVNPTGSDAQLVGWVDFGGSGVFGNTCGTDGQISANCGRSAAAVRVGATGLVDSGGSCSASGLAAGSSIGGADFTTGNIPANCEGVVVLVWRYTAADSLTLNDTFARFRITTDSTNGFFSDPSPFGFQTDGEVEDHLMDSGTIPVSIHAFESTFTREGLEVRWSTASETNNQGFYVWGVTRGGGLELLTPEMIPSKAEGIVEPQHYTEVIRGVSRGEIGDLVITAVDNFGAEEMYGYFRVGGAFGRENDADQIDWTPIRQAAENRMRGRGYRAIGNAWRRETAGARATVSAVDFKVSQPGMQQISFETLRQAGLDLTGVRVDDIAVTRNGVPVPRVLSTTTSGNRRGSSVARERAILFWGELPDAPDSLYIDEYVYRVELRPEAALSARPLDRLGDRPTRFSDLHYAVQTVEEDATYSPFNANPDPWFMYRLRSNSSSANRYNASFEVGGEMRRDMTARVRVRIAGLTDMPASPNHRIQVFVNGEEFEDYFFDGQTTQLIDIDVPGDRFFQGENTVTVVSPGGLEVISHSLLDSVSLSYPVAMRAKGNALYIAEPLVTASDQGLRVDGFRRTGSMHAFGWDGESLFEIPVTAVGREVAEFPLLSERDAADPAYWVSTSDAFVQPTLIGGVESADLASGLGELLLIVHPAFLPADPSDSHPLNDYVAHRQQGGWTVSVVDITDIQLHYGGGMPLPGAVNHFLVDALSSSKVSHVLLVGGDSYDYRDRYELGSLSFIPTHYAGTSYVSHTPSDARLADLDGDGLSDLALGRWPVRTLDDLRVSVQKVFDWEGRLAADRSAVWLTDENDPKIQPFSNQAERMLDILRGTGWPEGNIDRIFFEEIIDEGGTPDLARQQLFQALENGRTLTGFSGHGSPTLWSFQGILTSGDVAELGNQGLPTLISTAACYTSYFTSPFSETLAHRLMNGFEVDTSGVPVAATNGAVAVHGAATLSNYLQNEIFMRTVLEGLVAGDTLGGAIQQARIHAAELHMNDLVTNWTLLGDPTLRLSGNQPGR